MRIQIKTQEDRINELYQQILKLIDEMKRNNSRNNVTEVQKLQKEYWKIIMQRDISGVSEEKRNELLQYMAEYVPLGMQKGYFGKENILEVLERLTKGITEFEIEERRGIYGAWKNTGKLVLKPSLNGISWKTAQKQRMNVIQEHKTISCNQQNNLFLLV